jgi:hypothetical protein
VNTPIRGVVIEYLTIQKLIPSCKVHKWILSNAKPKRDLEAIQAHGWRKNRQSWLTTVTYSKIAWIYLKTNNLVPTRLWKAMASIGILLWFKRRN